MIATAFAASIQDKFSIEHSTVKDNNIEHHKGQIMPSEQGSMVLTLPSMLSSKPEKLSCG
jgi:hypothetical protein